jgi:hypothetical protein
MLASAICPPDAVAIDAADACTGVWNAAVDKGVDGSEEEVETLFPVKNIAASVADGGIAFPELTGVVRDKV